MLYVKNSITFKIDIVHRKKFFEYLKKLKIFNENSQNICPKKIFEI